MAIFIAVIIFLGIVFYSFLTSSSSKSDSISKEKNDFEDIYLIDKDAFDEEKDGFI